MAICNAGTLDQKAAYQKPEVAYREGTQSARLNF